MTDISINETDAITSVTVTDIADLTYDFDFLALEAETVLASVINADGTVTDLDQNNSDYTVTGLGSNSGGTITLAGSVTLVVGDQIVMSRSTPISRPNDYQTAGDFRAENINAELDDVYIIMQELRRDIDNAVKTPTGQGGVTIPSNLAAGRYIISDANGNYVDGGDADEIANAQGYAESAEQDAAQTAADRAAVEAALGTITIATFSSRALAEAADVDASVRTLLVSSPNGDILKYFREASGTALTTNDGQNWSPAGKEYADHWAENANPGTTDMTAAIQAMLDYVGAKVGIVKAYGRLLEYDYFVSDTLTINANGVGLKGEGSLSRLLRSGDYGDTIKVQASTPGNSHFYFRLKDLIIQQTADMNSGAHVQLNNTFHVIIENCHFWNGFQTFDIRGCSNCVIKGCRLDVGEHWTGTKVGSKYLFTGADTTSGAEVTSLFIDNCQFTTTGTPLVPSAVEYGIDIQQCDGIWIDNSHVFGAQTEIRITPEAADSQVQGIQISNTWFDQFSVHNVEIYGDTTNVLGDIEFNNCVFLNASDYAIMIGEFGTTNPVHITFNGGRVSSSTGKFAFLNRGTNCIWNGVRFQGGVPVGAAQVPAIDIRAAYRRFVFDGCSMDSYILSIDPIETGIDIEGTSNRHFLIDGFRFYNISQTEINIDGPILDGSKIEKITTDRANYQDIPTDGALDLDPVCDFFNVTGAARTIFRLNNGWEGRTVTLRSDTDTMTYQANNVGVANTTMRLNSPNEAIAAGETITLRYSARVGEWYQV